MALKKPKPRVKVILWSEQMKLKRPFEVQLISGPRDDQEEFAIQRYAKKEDAEAHATVLRDALAWSPPA
jgi:hypothetical protein